MRSEITSVTSDLRGSPPVVALVSGLVALLLLGLGLVQPSRQPRHALEIPARSALVRADLASLASEGRDFATAAEQLQLALGRGREMMLQALDGLPTIENDERQRFPAREQATHTAEQPVGVERKRERGEASR